jgi:hypothetical protein
MIETITLAARGMHVAVAARPVTRQEFKTYLAAVGEPLSVALARTDTPTAPVVFVSQTAAVAYCDWLGAREGRRCRLPNMAELHELADEVSQEGISVEIWPHYRQPHPEFRGGMRPTYLCEWTQETKELPQYGDAGSVRVLGSIFYPPWVRESGNSAQAQAYIHAAEGYSFVTFRVACEV